MIDRNYVFKGWDWCELSRCFDLELMDENEYDMKTLQAFLIEYSRRMFAGNPKEETDLVVTKCKEFLSKIAEFEHDFGSPVWKGLLEVKDDDTFLSFFIDLLPRMWT